jgi:hypothetical protein
MSVRSKKESGEALLPRLINLTVNGVCGDYSAKGSGRVKPAVPT